jgi:transcriptional regulator with XRE-family HTH domain
MRLERKIVELYNSGLKPKEIAERLGVSKSTVYRALAKRRECEGQELAERLEKAVERLEVLVNRLEALTDRLEAPPARERRYVEPVRVEPVQPTAQPHTQPPIQPAPQTVAQPPIQATPQPAPGIPDFIRENAWVKVLKGKR